MPEQGPFDLPPPSDPRAAARGAMRAALPQRFYAAVTVAEQDGAHAVLLDGRPVRTPARNLLLLPTGAAAAAVAAEWEAQGPVIDPAAMPLTRLVHTTIDGVAKAMDAVAAEVVKYAGSDLLCYRAGEPERLIARETAAWDPVLAWARDALGAQLILVEGITFARQPDRALAAIAAAVTAERDASPFRLAALHVMTTLTGSALLALAVARGRLAAEAAWAAAHVDEDYQMEVWGADEEAMERRARRWSEMETAARLLALTEEGRG